MLHAKCAGQACADMVVSSKEPLSIFKVNNMSESYIEFRN